MKKEEISRIVSNFKFTMQNIRNNIFRLRKRQDGQIIYLLNEGEIPRKFNATTDKVYGKTVSEIFGEQQANMINNYYERAFSGEIVQYRVQLEDVWFETILSPIEEKGVIIEVAGSSYDVTDKVKYQEEIERLNEELRDLLLTDKLTSLSNRRKLDTVLEYEILQSARYSRNLSIIFFDIDDFKGINDSYGHIIGDEVLEKVSEITKSNVRDTDTPGRWGGEEFLIICPETCVEKAKVIAERIRQRIESSTYKTGFKVTASFGVSELKSGMKKTTFVAQADQLMYKAKQNGKNRVEI